MPRRVRQRVGGGIFSYLAESWDTDRNQSVSPFVPLGHYSFGMTSCCPIWILSGSFNLSRFA